MTPSCLGSPGAARVLGAAGTRRCYGASGLYAAWRIGELYLTCDSAGRWCCCGREVGRATARLILTGLLAPDATREFAEWLESESSRYAGYNHTGLNPQAQSVSFAFTDVLAKLRGFGVVTK